MTEQGQQSRQRWFPYSRADRTPAALAYGCLLGISVPAAILSLLGGLAYLVSSERRAHPDALMSIACPAIPFAIVLCWTAISAFRQSSTWNRRNAILLATAIVTALGVTALAAVGIGRQARWDRSQEPFRQRAGDACTGKGTPQAHPFQAGPAFHPTILLGRKGGLAGWDALAYSWGWQPAALDAVELAGCVDQDRLAIETCNYTMGGHVTRLQKILHVQLRSLRTGELVAEESFYGSLPNACPDKINAGGGGETVGGSVSSSEVREWMRQYVNPPQ